MFHSKKISQIILLYSTTFIGVVLGVVVSVLNTHSLSPADYGDVRYINNFIAFFSGILLFGYFVSGSRLLAVAKSPKECAELKGAVITILCITVFVLVILICICGLVHQFVLHKDYAYLFYWVLPVCSPAILLNYINTTPQGDNSISMIAAARVFPSLIYLLLAYFVYRKYGASVEKMLWLQNGISVVILIILIWKNSPSFSNLKKSLKILYKENKKYGLEVYYGSLANVSVQYVAGISLGLYASNNVNVGFYTLALTVTSPLAMLPNVIGTTYFKQFASQSTISRKIIVGTIGMSLLSLLGFILLIFPIVDILYDESYQSVAVYACFLAVGSMMQGLGDVFNRFLGAHGKGKPIRNVAWISGGIAIVGYILGVYVFGLYGAIATRIISSVSYFLAIFIYYRQFVRLS
ncbi:lipopolysaccharide biosynthesis protein [Bacteroides acidifaciens]|uniref:lipopolysaccharide biosynthesis protein n=1 Tax=Bacteroides acidifaciens TaxID=85831 RepID=UPI00242B7D92|nr:oligosaccharide flippase family protein [Bacteroides acidifaciens]